LGEEEQSVLRTELLIYPNPTTESLTVRLTNEMINVISVNDVNGRIVYSQEFAKGKREVPVSLNPFASGVYFIHVNNTYHAKVSKL
jgi:hypothetical protein